MRIAINALFWNQPATGSGQYIRRLATHLSAEEPDLELLLVTPRGTSLHRAPAGSRHLATRVSALRGPGKLAYEQCAFAGAGRANAARVLHVPYFAPPWRPRIPLVVTIHDLIPLLLPEYRGGPLVRAYSAWAAYAARYADRVLTDSNASARDIMEHLRLPPDRVQVVYLAADDGYRPASALSDASGGADPVLAEYRGRMGLPESYLLYLGGFDRRKQVPELLAAYARSGLQNRLPLVIAGRLPASDTAFAPDPRRVAQALGLHDAVQFTGWIEEADKPALYRCARAFVFPSLYEGFGLPVLESLASGTPVIATSGSSLEEVAGPGGLLVAPGDSDGLADAMQRLASDDTLHVTLSAAGLAHAAGFSWECTARETARAYREVAGG